MAVGGRDGGRRRGSPRAWSVLAAAALAAAAAPPLAWQATRAPAAVGAPVAPAVPAVPAVAEAGAPSPPGPSPAPSPADPGTAASPASPAAASPPGPALPVLVARPAPPLLLAEAPEPVRLRVPALGVDAPVDAVGLARGGVAVPEDGARTGWYRYGARPGDGRGSTVVVGHVDTPAGPGALFRLGRAEVGQEVAVEDAAGAVVTYRVTGRELLPKDELPAAALFTTAGPPRLVLISCGGPFDEETGHYRDNVVVVAEPVPPDPQQTSP